MSDDTKCTCRIVKAPTYDVYVQMPCGIHYRMVEEAVARERETCAQIAESEPELEGPMPPENIAAAKLVSLEDHLRITVRLTKTNIAKRIRGT